MQSALDHSSTWNTNYSNPCVYKTATAAHSLTATFVVSNSASLSAHTVNALLSWWGTSWETSYEWTTEKMETLCDRHLYCSTSPAMSRPDLHETWSGAQTTADLSQKGYEINNISYSTFVCHGSSIYLIYNSAVGLCLFPFSWPFLSKTLPSLPWLWSAKKGLIYKSDQYILWKCGIYNMYTHQYHGSHVQIRNLKKVVRLGCITGSTSTAITLTHLTSTHSVSYNHRRRSEQSAGRNDWWNQNLWLVTSMRTTRNGNYVQAWKSMVSLVVVYVYM